MAIRKPVKPTQPPSIAAPALPATTVKPTSKPVQVDHVGASQRQSRTTQNSATGSNLPKTVADDLATIQQGSGATSFYGDGSGKPIAGQQEGC